MMDESISPYIEGFKARSSKILDPNFFGLYSFEYAYRLFLVYLSTQRNAIWEVRVKEPNAFDDLFKGDIDKAITTILQYRGIDLSNEDLNSISGIASEALVIFIKSSMNNDPTKLAKSISKAMDKALLDKIDSNLKSAFQKTFSE